MYDNVIPPQTSKWQFDIENTQPLGEELVFLTNACFYCVVNTNMNSMLAQFIKTLH